MYIIYFLCFFLVRRLTLRKCNFLKKRIFKIKKMVLETWQYFQQLSVYDQYRIFEFCILKKSPKTEQIFWKFRTTKKKYSANRFFLRKNVCVLWHERCLLLKKKKKILLLSFPFALQQMVSLAIVSRCAFLLF